MLRTGRSARRWHVAEQYGAYRPLCQSSISLVQYSQQGVLSARPAVLVVMGMVLFLSVLLWI
jgi:hypothetical protein